jgi:MFS family permease
MTVSRPGADGSTAAAVGGATTRKRRPSSMQKAAFAAAVSASLEWYDFFVYATAAALVFNKTFFASDSAVVAAISSFATVAVGFIARPIGGFVAGHLGDTYGRKPVLTGAILLMGIATTLIGCVPDTSIAWLAPAILVTLRICQGLAVGGQWGGAVLLATEHAPANRRGLFGGFAQIGVPMGVVLGNAVFLLVTAATSSEVFMSWGWRVPFWISLLMIGVAFAIHYYLEETPEFQNIEAKLAAAPQDRRSPIVQVLRRNGGTVALVGATYLIGLVMFYVTITGSIQAATVTLGIARSDVLMFVLIGSCVMVPTVPLAAYLSDRFGRKLIYGFGIVFMGIWGLPMWLLIGSATTDNLWPIAVALIVSCIAMGFQSGPQAALFAELFPPETRYSGASLGYQAAAIIGGMAPMVMVALVNDDRNNLWRVGALVLATAALSLACLIGLAYRRR